MATSGLYTRIGAGELGREALKGNTNCGVSGIAGEAAKEGVAAAEQHERQ